MTKINYIKVKEYSRKNANGRVSMLLNKDKFDNFFYGNSES